MRGIGSFACAMALFAAFLACAGCGSDETVNNYYQTPQLVQIRTSYLPEAVVSQAYSVTLAAAGGGGTYAWSIETGGINDSWLSIGATSGVLSGTPTTAGSFVVIVRCADADNASNFDIVRYEQFSFSVLIRTSYVPDAVLGAAYSVALEATGGSGSYEWSIETGGGNDSWLAIGLTTGVLSGTPHTLMDVAVNVRVEDTANADFDTARIEFSVVHADFPGSEVDENNHDGDCFKNGAMPSPAPMAPGVMTWANHYDGTGICFAKCKEPLPYQNSAVDIGFTTETGWKDGEPVVNDSNGSYGIVRSGGGTSTIEVEIESGSFNVGDDVAGRFSGASDTVVSVSASSNQYQACRYTMWASRFSGTAFTPWVEIRGAYDTSYLCTFTMIYSTRVVFLNTQGNSAAQGGNRAGDAVILFSAWEIDTVADVRLFSTYFDVTNVAVPALASNPAIKYGFNTEATAVNSNTNTSDVEAVAVMTDGMYQMTPSFDSSLSFFMNGSQVTYVGAVWTERPRTGLGLKGYLCFADFDLSDSNTTNKFESPNQLTTATTFVEGFVDDRLVIAGNVIFYRVMIENAGFNHRVLEAADWNSTSGTLQHATRLTRTDTDDEVRGEIDSLAAFGSIQGLTRAYAIGTESGYDEGGFNPDSDLMLYIFDPSTGTAQVAEIDGDDSNGTAMHVSSFRADHNRTCEVIFVGWTQAYSDTNASESFFTQAVQTTGTGRTLANSILAVPLRMNSDYQTTINYADVVEIGFPSDQMGTLTFTSNHLRLNTVFLQEPDTIMDIDNLALHTAYIDVTLSTSVTTRPTAAGGSTSDQTIWTNDVDHPFWRPSEINMRNFVCLDSGTGGKPIVYFIADGDGSPQDETATDPSESRLFVWDGRETTPTAVEISGDCTDCGINTFGYTNSRQVRGFKVSPTAFSAYAGTGTEDNAADYHHIVILEERDVPGSWTALRHRCLDLNSAAPLFKDKFFPALSLQPFNVDLDTAAECMINITMEGMPLPVNGNTLALYFLQDGHVYYNEYTPGSSATWLLENGVTAPRRVDDDSDEDVVWGNSFLIPPFVIGAWDLIGGSPFFYSKTIGSEDKLFVRIHD